ncbi:MAG: hypothetical protein ACFFC3_10750 [Candidatus Odinarchaeota archaeon]
MPLNSDLESLTHSNGDQFHRFLNIFDKIIKILKDFEGNYEKRFNFTKLMDILNIPSIYTQQFVNIILKNQALFHCVFQNYYLEKRKENNTLYLVAHKKIPDVISMTRPQIKILNDIIYTFKYIKKGKGFDISENDAELLSNITSLKTAYPYFFDLNENGLLYPSLFGFKLGELIISYNKANKEIHELLVDNHILMVVEDE